MTWTPTYNARFTKPLVRQLLAIIQRDQRDALDWVGETPNLLPSIVTYQLAPNTIPQFPALLIVPVESVFMQDAVGSRQSANQVFCSIAATHQDNTTVAELVQDYLLAMDAVLNTVPLSDFYTAIPYTHPVLGPLVTTPLEAGSVKELFVRSHGYGEIRKGRNGFSIAATLEIFIDREET